MQALEKDSRLVTGYLRDAAPGELESVDTVIGCLNMHLTRYEFRDERLVLGKYLEHPLAPRE